MATPAEINFIIRMRDEASRVLQALGGSFGRTGEQAKKLEREFGGMSGAAAEAGRAIAGAFASNIGARATLGVFAQYEQGMVGVAKTSDLTRQELAEFSKGFDVLAGNIKGVGVQDLLSIAQTAGQVGIKGSAGILKFTEVLAKLQTATDIVGDEGAQKLARVLLAAGVDISKGGKEIEQFASALVQLGNDIPGRESEILDLTSSLAQSAAGFKLNEVAMVGLASAAASLNFKPELFGAAVARTLTQLKEAALTGGEGMELLTEITGKTQAEFKDLVNTHPEKAIELFLQALNAQGGTESSTLATLEKFNLSAEENQRVLGTLAANIKVFRTNMDTAFKAAGANTALEKEYQQFAATINANFQSMKNNAFLFGKAMGASVAPAALAALVALQGILKGAAGVFMAMPPYVQGLITSLVILGPAVIALTAAFRVLTFVSFIPMLNVFKLAVPVIAAMRTQVIAAALAYRILGASSLLALGPLGLIAGLVAGAVYVAFNKDMIADWIERNLGEGALARIREFRSNLQGLIDFLNTDFMTGIIQEGPNKGKRNGFWGGLVEGSPEAEQTAKDEAARLAKLAVEEKNKVFERDSKANGFAELNGVPTLNDDFRRALEDLDEYTKSLREVREIERALEAQRQINANAPDASTAKGEEEMRRLQRLYEVRKRLADPVEDVNYELDKSLRAVQAVTGAAQAELAVQEKITEVLERKGIILEGEADSIRQRVMLLKQEQANNNYDDIIRGQQQQLAGIKAVTGARKASADAEALITDFLRDNVALTKEQEGAIRANVAVLQQYSDLLNLVGQTNPIGAANQEYIESQRVLKAALDAGMLSAENYKNMLEQLDRVTLAARDPVADRIKSMREELKLSSLSKRDREAEAQVISEVNSLRDRGVVVTDNMTDAIRRYTVAMIEVNRLQSTGVTGWIESIGTMEEQLDDITKQGLDGFADAFTDMLTGTEDSFQQWLGNLGKLLLNAAVKNAMAKLLESFNLGDTRQEDALDRANRAANELEQLKQNQIIQAQTATINAAAVTLAGEGLRGIVGEGYGGIGSPGGVERRPLPDINDNRPSAYPYGDKYGGNQPKGGSYPYGGKYAGNDIAMAKDLLREKEGFRSKPYWDVNALRAGYGSDTHTDAATGRVSRIHAGSFVSRADAEADLDRRLGQFQSTIQKQIGAGNFNELTPQTKAALTSTAYNYGSLPSRHGLLGAAQSGDTEQIARALEALKRDNGGVNASRRQHEADLVRSGGQVASVDPAAVQQAATAVQTMNTNVSNTSRVTAEAANANQRVAQAHQVTAQSATTSSAAITQAKTANDNLANSATNAALGVQQASTALANTKQVATTTAPALGSVTAGTDGLKAGLSAAVGPLSSLIPGLGQLGGIFQSLLQSIIGGIGGGGGGGGFGGTILTGIMSLFGGGKATGGKVKDGEFYQVGERGPEIFAPGKSGTIIPNHNLPKPNENGLRKRQSQQERQAGNTNYSPTTTFAPSISVQVQGPANGNQQDNQMLGKQIGDQVNMAVEAKFMEMLTKEMRPQGAIARRGFRS